MPALHWSTPGAYGASLTAEPLELTLDRADAERRIAEKQKEDAS